MTINIGVLEKSMTGRIKEYCKALVLPELEKESGFKSPDGFASFFRFALFQDSIYIYLSSWNSS